MIKKSTPILLIVCTMLLAACSSSENQSQLNTDQFSFAEDNGSITLPDGFRAVVVADSVGRARHLVVDDDGDIYVALSDPHNGHGIAALRDEDGDGVADRTEYFGNYTGTGINLYNGYLYFSTDTTVMRYPMSENSLVPDASPEMMVEDFPVQHQHAPKAFTFDNNGNIYVNVGAPSNACQEKDRTPGSPGMNPCPLLEKHGGIWQFNATQPGQTQDDGNRYATGLRNVVGLDWNNTNNSLYVMQHGRDQLHTLYPDYYSVEESAVLPAEEFFHVEEGDNFGWPYTYYDQNKEQIMLAPEYGGNGKKTVADSKYAGQFKEPIMAFPGHWAPNDLLFYTGSQFPDRYKNGAFIAFHGSWNRAPKPQAGYRVAFVPFEGDNPAGDYETFANGFAGTDTLMAPSNAEYRPVGLALDTQGTLYISDSMKGKIWRVVYTGDQE